MELVISNLLQFFIGLPQRTYMHCNYNSNCPEANKLISCSVTDVKNLLICVIDWWRKAQQSKTAKDWQTWRTSLGPDQKDHSFQMQKRMKKIRFFLWTSSEGILQNSGTLHFFVCKTLFIFLSSGLRDELYRMC